MVYTIGPFTLSLATRELRRAGELRPVEPKVFDLISYLVANRERIVGKDEINEALWQGRAVSDAALSGCVKAARRALDDDGAVQAMIRTAHGRGFRFVGEVTQVESSEPAVAPGECAPCGPEWEAKVGCEADALATRPRILVMPFEASSDVAPYLADGLTDELIAALSAWRWFPIVSRNTAFRYKSRPMAAPKVACETGARYLVTAQLRQAEESLAIAVQLVDALADEVIFTHRLVRTRRELSQLEDDIARSIVARLVPEIEAAETRRVRRSSTEDVSAWDAALRAMWHVHRRTNEDLNEAERFALIAAERDPTWGTPLALHAFALFQRAHMGWSGTGARDSYRGVLRAAKAALEVDTSSWIGHALCGVGELWSNLAYDRALWHAHRAIELNPSASWSYHFFGCVSGFAGRLDIARAHPAKAHLIDPAYPHAAIIEADLGLWAMLSGEYHAAEDHLSRSLAWDGDYARALQRRAALRGLAGQREAAYADLQRLTQLGGVFDREYYETSYPFRVPAHREMFFSGLRAAGFNDIT